MTTPPATTRAWLRGRFVAAGLAAGRDFTADWAHLKVVGESRTDRPAQGPVPVEDARVDALIATWSSSPRDVD